MHGRDRRQIGEGVDAAGAQQQTVSYGLAESLGERRDELVDESVAETVDAGAVEDDPVVGRGVEMGLDLLPQSEGSRAPTEKARIQAGGQNHVHCRDPGIGASDMGLSIVRHARVADKLFDRGWRPRRLQPPGEWPGQ